MSAAESMSVVDRLAAKRADLGVEEFAKYAFLAFALLAFQAPEVADFILDRADERTPDRSRPGLGAAGVTGAQPDEPVSQAGRPATGGA